MKRTILGALFLLYSISLPAQITFADDEYINQMTASNYVNEPLSLENCFKSYDGTSLQGYMFYNIVGDTLFTFGVGRSNGDLPIITVNHKDKKIYISKVPEGLYRVKAIYLGGDADAGRKDVISEIYNYIDKGYSNYLLDDQPFKTVEKFVFERCSYDGVFGSKEINKWIQEYQLGGKPPRLRDCAQMYCLESLDSNYLYYMDNSYFGKKGDLYPEQLFLPKKYYDFINNELKGKDVVFKGGFITSFPKPYERIVYDGLTEEEVFLKDTLFHCDDVCVNNDLKVCCVFNGKKTGKFAIEINSLVEELHPNNLYYYLTPSGKMNIWPSYEKESVFYKGKLVRDRHFEADIRYSNHYWDIFLVQDLNNIYAETKRFNTLTASQQKQEQDRKKTESKAKETKRKQELIAKYGNEIGTLIVGHKVTLGMDQEMCKLAWGNPIHISNMVDSSVKYTIWKYNLKTYVYFYNGKVNKILN